MQLQGNSLIGGQREQATIIHHAVPGQGGDDSPATRWRGFGIGGGPALFDAFVLTLVPSFS